MQPFRHFSLRELFSATELPNVLAKSAFYERSVSMHLKNLHDLTEFMKILASFFEFCYKVYLSKVQNLKCFQEVASKIRRYRRTQSLANIKKSRRFEKTSPIFPWNAR